MTTPPAPGRAEAHEWRLYRRMGEIEAREWTEHDFHEWTEQRMGISVSDVDVPQAHRLPCVGMVARNPANHLDQWYIAPDYFAKHYAPVSRPAPAIVAEVGDDPTDTREFYELMQTYRHTHIVAQADVVKAYDAVREFVRRTLAEVRAELKQYDPDPVVCGCREAGCEHQPVSKIPRQVLVDHYRERIRSEREYAEQVEAQRDAATQRAEKAERDLATVRTNLYNAIDAKQAKIDALMWEFCPGEMSAEQREAWARNQKAVALPAPATNATGDDGSLRAAVVANT